MKINPKNVYGVMIGGILLAFILMTNLYPFMRMGMFAEPIQSNKQTELFLVFVTDSLGKKIQIDKNFGLSKNRISYLGRKYFYQDQSDKFLQIVADGTNMNGQFEFNQILVYKENSDTTIVSTYVK